MLGDTVSGRIEISLQGTHYRNLQALDHGNFGLFKQLMKVFNQSIEQFDHRAEMIRDSRDVYMDSLGKYKKSSARLYREMDKLYDLEKDKTDEAKTRLREIQCGG